jgi:hypothetical protein
VGLLLLVLGILYYDNVKNYINFLNKTGINRSKNFDLKGK